MTSISIAAGLIIGALYGLSLKWAIDIFLRSQNKRRYVLGIFLSLRLGVLALLVWWLLTLGAQIPWLIGGIIAGFFIIKYSVLMRK
jgi:hypothetical protein